MKQRWISPSPAAACGALLAVAAAAAESTELTVQQVAGSEGAVLAMPVHDSGPLRSAAAGGATFDIVTARGVRTYRAHVAGITYTKHVDVSGPPTRVVFDPAAMRFRKLASSIRVELDDLGDLGRLAREIGAVAAKAYPPLGFAVLRLAPTADPVDAVRRLDTHAEVLRSELLFDERATRPMPTTRPYWRRVWRETVTRLVSRVSGSRPAMPPIGPNRGVATADKETLAPDLLIGFQGIIGVSETSLTARVYALNWGAAPTLATALFLWLYDNQSLEDPLVTEIRYLPALDPKTEYLLDVSVSLTGLPPGTVYYAAVVAPAEEQELLTYNNADFAGFALDDAGLMRVTCTEPGRGASPGVADPLLEHQWHLQNTGRSRYTDSASAASEDLRMAGILADGPDGGSVRVAVVDTGLQTCHPDLAAAVEQDASFNFGASGALHDSFGMEITDPFNPSTAGDHGTSVAGLIAAAAANGIGGRGVAPGVRLRGYNPLSAQDGSSTAFLDALGASSYAPDSTDVDIFNMSFGRLGYPSNASQEWELLFAHGARRLRDGRGAVYVKAAGNGFGACAALRHPLNSDTGCVGSNGDRTNNLPYPIVVGALNAQGTHARYSAAGPNLWVSAPAGDRGLITTDQLGKHIGYELLLGERLAGADPDGDYTASFAGTSAAAPAVAGVVALLLDAAPELTWRDVKHILANTARRVDPAIRGVQHSAGDQPRTVRYPWIRNGAGYRFHDWYGFGAVDADAALAAAREHPPDGLGEFHRSGWFEAPGGGGEIPDDHGRGIAPWLTVAGLPESANIEAVMVEVDLDHPFPHDLGIRLASPAGTRSTLNAPFNDALAVDFSTRRLRWRLLSNAFYGEVPNGDWRILVFDGAPGDVGELQGWRMRFYFGEHPE